MSLFESNGTLDNWHRRKQNSSSIVYTFYFCEIDNYCLNDRTLDSKISENYWLMDSSFKWLIFGKTLYKVHNRT